MIVKIPDYEKAIDVINKILASGQIRVKSPLYRQLQCEAAGFAAEKQMAYQLTRYFQTNKNIIVYNNLEICFGDVRTQIDHLVCSCHGVYLIESKSINGNISVNNYGEFTRKNKPINSPVMQVKSQKKVLFDFLNENSEEILGKWLGLQKGFKTWTPKYYVAVSEKAKIVGSGRGDFKGILCKFDQIPEMIKKYYEDTDKKIGDFFRDATDEEFKVFSKKEFAEFGNFLKSKDKSKEPLLKIQELVKQPKYRKDIIANGKNEPKPTGKKMPSGNTSKFKCSKCGSADIQIMYGRNYYFKCKDCGGNTPINLICEDCQKPARTRKKGDEFYKVCSICESDKLYFRN